MPVSVKQGYFRPSSIGDSADGTLTYYTFNEEDEVVAHTAALAQVVIDWPSGYRGMPLRATSIEKIAPGVCKVPFTFSLSQQQTRPSDPAISEFNTTQTFNLVGGTAHITNSLEVTQTVVADGFTAMDFKGAIGVEFSADGSQTRVRGADIFAPVMDLTYTTQFKNSVVNEAYIDDLHELTGSTNNATFKRREAGSMLFKGARGSQRGMDYWEIGFDFAYSANKTDLTFGELTGINKKGWQLLDILYRPAADRVNGLEVLVAKQAIVHTVYYDSDFSKLKIGVA